MYMQFVCFLNFTGMLLHCGLFTLKVNCANELSHYHKFQEDSEIYCILIFCKTAYKDENVLFEVSKLCDFLNTLKIIFKWIFPNIFTAENESLFRFHVNKDVLFSSLNIPVFVLYILNALHFHTLRVY